MKLGSEPGWAGVFTRHQAPGAIANGTQVYKAAEERGDATPLGTVGEVLGSIPSPPDLGAQYPAPDGEPVRFAYFVEWRNRPRVAVGVLDWKIKEGP